MATNNSKFVIPCRGLSTYSSCSRISASQCLGRSYACKKIFVLKSSSICEHLLATDCTCQRQTQRENFCGPNCLQGREPKVLVFRCFLLLLHAKKERLNDCISLHFDQSSFWHVSWNGFLYLKSYSVGVDPLRLPDIWSIYLAKLMLQHCLKLSFQIFSISQNSTEAKKHHETIEQAGHTI